MQSKKNYCHILLIYVWFYHVWTCRLVAGWYGTSYIGLIFIHYDVEKLSKFIQWEFKLLIHSSTKGQ